MLRGYRQGNTHLILRLVVAVGARVVVGLMDGVYATSFERLFWPILHA